MKRSLLSTTSAFTLLFPLIVNAVGIQVILQGKVVTFTDVPSTAWYATYVKDAAQAGIVNGYKDIYGNFTGRFKPANNITVAEALKIAVQGAGYDTNAYSSVIDSGVGNHWASAYVSVAKGEHFAITSDAVSLDRAATREEVASIFTSAFHVNMDAQSTTTFKDVMTNDPNAPSIAALERDQIVSGDTDASGAPTNTFRPTAFITRSEVVKMIMLARTQYGEVGQGRKPVVSNDQTTVIYTDSGFSPMVIHVKAGTTVTFQNHSTDGMWITGTANTTYSAYPGLDSRKSYVAGQVYLFVFESVGTWGYENRMNPAAVGTVIVDQ